MNHYSAIRDTSRNPEESTRSLKAALSLLLAEGSAASFYNEGVGDAAWQLEKLIILGAGTFSAQDITAALDQIKNLKWAEGAK